MLFVDAPAGSALHAWAAALPPPTSPVRIFAADDEAALARTAAAVAAQPDLRTIAGLPLDPAHWLGIPPGAAALVHVRADAYASCPRTAAQALAFVTAEDRAARAAGPARLVVLGPLGMAQLAPAAGVTCPLRRTPGPAGEPARTRVGRAPACELAIPQGHSDQSNLARIHLLIEPTATGWSARDAGATNGTWLHRAPLTVAPLAPLTVAPLAPGDELVLAGLFRIRLDGAG